MAEKVERTKSLRREMGFREVVWVIALPRMYLAVERRIRALVGWEKSHRPAPHRLL